MNSFRRLCMIYPLLILLLALCACTPARPRPAGTQNAPGALNPNQPQLSKPTFTPLPQTVGQTAVSSSESYYAFHINLALDESVTCPGTGKCDFPYITKFNLYFRGDVSSNAAGSLSGDGDIVLLDAQPCRTHMPDNSTCQVTTVSNGSFSIAGSAQDNQLHLTLHLEKMPTLGVVMTSSSPSGDVVVDFTNTYQEEMKKMFENAGIFDQEFQATAAISTSSAARVYEGSYTFAGTRTLHGFGSLFFINSDSALHQPYTP